MAKYREGQEVRISMEANKIRSEVHFLPQMGQFKGQIVKISSLIRDRPQGEPCYHVEGNSWSWAEVWLEEVAPAEKREVLTPSMVEIVVSGGDRKIVCTNNIYGYCGEDVVRVENGSSMWNNRTCIIGGSEVGRGIWHKPVEGRDDYKYCSGKNGFILLERKGLKFKVGDRVDDEREVLVINPHTEQYYVSDPENESVDESCVEEDWWPKRCKGKNMPFGMWLTEEEINNPQDESKKEIPKIPLSGMLNNDHDLAKVARVFFSKFNDAQHRGHSIVIPISDCVILGGTEDLPNNRVSINADGECFFFRIEEKHLPPNESLRFLGVILYHLASGRSELNDESFISEGYEGKPLDCKAWSVIKVLLNGRECDSIRSEQLISRFA